jgi:hypothetical protein
MPNAPVFIVYHFHYWLATEFSRIARLATRGRIEGRTVEINPPPIGGDSHHFSFKFGQVRVVIVQTFGCHF